MPVHDVIKLGEVNLDQAAPTRATPTGAGLGLIDGPMGGTHQPVTRAVKKTIRLVVHLHRHMGASIEVGVRLSLVTNGKGTASLAAIKHVKRDSFTAVDQIR